MPHLHVPSYFGSTCFTNSTWWRHQMETFSALLAICAGNSPVPGEFPTQRPVTRSFNVFFDLRLNKRLSKQSWGWWSETPPRPLWRHSNDTVDDNSIPHIPLIIVESSNVVSNAAMFSSEFHPNKLNKIWDSKIITKYVPFKTGSSLIWIIPCHFHYPELAYRQLNTL